MDFHNIHEQREQEPPVPYTIIAKRYGCHPERVRGAYRRWLDQRKYLTAPDTLTTTTTDPVRAVIERIVHGR